MKLRIPTDYALIYNASCTIISPGRREDTGFQGLLDPKGHKAEIMLIETIRQLSYFHTTLIQPITKVKLIAYLATIGYIARLPDQSACSFEVDGSSNKPTPIVCCSNLSRKEIARLTGRSFAFYFYFERLGKEKEKRLNELP
jgi:hypothetical protein